MAFIDPFQKIITAGAHKQNSIVVPWDGLGTDNAGVALPALSADGDGSWLNVSGEHGQIYIEIATISGTGTCSFAVDGTFDAASKATGSSNITPVRYALLGAVGALAPIVAATAVAASPTVKWIALQDFFPTIAVKISSASGTFAVTTRAFLVPQS